MEFWRALANEIHSGHQVVLMYVLQSKGSSPGRQGFKMFVSSSGLLEGSIGGGFMEHKWVEQCKNKWLNADFTPFIKHQIHQKDTKKYASGLICSGEQTIAFYKITNNHIHLIHQIAKGITDKTYGLLMLNHDMIEFLPFQSATNKFDLELDDNFLLWNLVEDIGFMPKLYIAGGGHVSLALSKLANQLGFDVHVFDNRQDLNTVENNEFATTTIVNSYSELSSLIPNNPNSYVVLMSFGYVTDKIILKSVIHQNYKYLGMMGSKKKVDQLFSELEKEGIKKELLDRVYSPIGISIKSETPEEIAISILAELIKVKNS